MDLVHPNECLRQEFQPISSSFILTWETQMIEIITLAVIFSLLHFRISKPNQKANNKNVKHPQNEKINDVKLTNFLR